MRLIKKLSTIDFVRFCIVGAAGFLINLALLNLFYKQLDLDIFIAQLLASEIALFHNFSLHHNWTYKTRGKTKSILNYITEFHVASWVAIIGSALLVSFCVRVLHFNYLIALILSSFIALFWNFFWTKYYIWNDKMSQIAVPKDEE